MRKVVVCRGCKYFSIGEQNHIFGCFCTNPKYAVVRYSPVEGKIKEYSDVNRCNKNCNCKLREEGGEE